MKRYFKMLPFAWLGLTLALFSGTIFGWADTASQKQKASAQAQEAAQEAEPEYSEEEYNAYDAADKESDLLKRGTMLMDFVGKYPKSKLMPYIDAAYRTLMFDCSNGKKYAELEILGEQWLKLHPGDVTAIAYIADAAEKLGHDEKCVQCLHEIYKMQPTAGMAFNIAQTYKKMRNRAKYLEWAETVFKYPEYESDFALRLDLVQIFAESSDFPKAAQYARAALKSSDLVTQPSAELQPQLRAVRRACYDIIGRSLLQQNKFDDAIASFQQALKEEPYGEGYYYIALCQRNQNKIDEALLSYAKAELHGGEVAAKAKTQLEELYRVLHNGNLTGIEKIRTRARKEQPETAANIPGVNRGL